MKQLTTLSLLALLGACGITKRSSTASISAQYDRQHTFSYNFSEDSVHKYWYFHTDSPFYYHPEMGLWAFSGHIGLQNFYQQRSHTAFQTDSTAYIQLQNKEERLERRVTDGWYWIKLIVWGVIVAVTIYCVLRWKNI